MMEGSHSWRVTAPLRASRRLAGRGRSSREEADFGYRAGGLSRVSADSQCEARHQGDYLPHGAVARAAYGGLQGVATAINRDRPTTAADWERRGGSRRSWADRGAPSGNSVEKLRRRGRRIRPADDCTGRRHQNQGDRVLPAAVPPDSRERSVVGQGVHRVAQRRPWRERSSRDTISRTCQASWASTTFVWSTCSVAKSSWPRRTGFTDSVITTIGSAASDCSGARSISCWPIPTSTFPSACAGRTRTGRGAGMAWTAEMLIAQQHSPEDDLAFIRTSRRALRDDRYIRVDGRPLLDRLPPRSAARRARRPPSAGARIAGASGLPDLFLVSAQAFDRIEPA